MTAFPDPLRTRPTRLSDEVRKVRTILLNKYLVEGREWKILQYSAMMLLRLSIAGVDKMDI